MTKRSAPDPYGVLIEPATLKLERLLPGPIERVWDYLTKSDLRAMWLASGEMEMKADAPFELVWRNDKLDPPSTRPPEFSEEHRMDSRVIECDPPRKLVFTWSGSGDVSFELTPKGKDVLLTLIHRRLGGRPMMLKVAAGWHTHLDLLAARISGEEAEPFWDHWKGLVADYDRLLPA